MLSALINRIKCLFGYHEFIYSDHVFDEACGIDGECDEKMCTHCGTTKIMKDEE